MGKQVEKEVRRKVGKELGKELEKNAGNPLGIAGCTKGVANSPK